MRQAVLCEVRAATTETGEERNIQCVVIGYKHHRHFYDYETSVLIDGKSVDNTYDREILGFVLPKDVISGSLSPRPQVADRGTTFYMEGSCEYIQ